MKTLLLILALAFTASAQTPDWKLIKEMSGDIPNHPGLTMELYAAEIARGENKVKLLVRMDFPWGSPKFEGAKYPTGFDTSSINRVVFRVDFNCDTLVVKPVNGSAIVYQFNGKHIKSKEPPFKIASEHIWSQYFCEKGGTPTVAPTLKTKP